MFNSYFLPEILVTAAYVDQIETNRRRSAYDLKRRNDLEELAKAKAELLSSLIHRMPMNGIANNIDRIIYNDPATIVFWKNGEKTVVRCHEDDTYDLATGLAMAYLKHSLGDKYNTMLKDTVMRFKYMLDTKDWNVDNVNKKIAELASDLKKNLIDETYIEPVLTNLLVNRKNSTKIPEWFDKVIYPKDFESTISKILDLDIKKDNKKDLTKDSTTTKSNKTTTTKKATTYKKTAAKKTAAKKTAAKKSVTKTSTAKKSTK